MNTLLIVNPQSSGGRTGRILPQLERTLSHSLEGEYHIEQTREARHATRLARQAAKDGYQRVVAIGGDWTLNEVINGLMQASQEDKCEKLPVLGLIPQGTGGDFRRSFAIEHRLDHYLRKLNEADTHSLDIGKAEFVDHQGNPKKHYFVNILSAGLGGLVDQYVEESKGGNSGKASYFMASLKAMRCSKLARLRCTVDLRVGEGEKVDQRTFVLGSRNIAICNGRYFGGGMHVAPMAKTDDGTFEVINFSAPKRLQLAAMSRKLYDGKHLQLPHVQHFQASSIRLELIDESIQKDFLLDIDGEALGCLPLHIEVLPAALQIQL